MSIPPRLYVSADLASDQSFLLEEDQSKYLTRVMRLGIGDKARVFNGRDGEWSVKISAVEGRKARLTPTAQSRLQPEKSGPSLTLMFTPVKKSQTDFIVEKATELGAAVLQPVLTARSQTRNVRLDRFEKIALEAAEQTERLDLPVIHPLAPLEHLLNTQSAQPLIFCDEAGDEVDRPWGGATGRGEPMPDVLAKLQGQSVTILIGPEGGFSPEERDYLRERANTYAVSLGPRILRAETAAIAAMTLWQAHCGDW